MPVKTGAAGDPALPEVNSDSSDAAGCEAALAAQKRRRSGWETEAVLRMSTAPVRRAGRVQYHPGTYRCGLLRKYRRTLGKRWRKTGLSGSCSRKKIRKSSRRYRLMRGLLLRLRGGDRFEESEALSNCAFCGRSLVRSEYLDTDGHSENDLPLRLTEEEAGERFKEWCDKNSGKAEAKHLRPLLKELKGFYLPYELVRGPVHMTVSRMDGGGNYPCDGFINDEFVNRSKQLDNLLLDGM